MSARSRIEPVNRAARAKAEQQRTANRSGCLWPAEEYHVAVEAGADCGLSGGGYIPVTCGTVGKAVGELS